MGRIFRRDRLTGQLAIGLVGVLTVTAIVYGVGVAGAKYALADVGAWLGAWGKGMVIHANGPAGKVDGKAKLPDSMRGHKIKVVQDGTTVLIVDLETGVVSRIDPSQLTVKQNRGFGTAGIQVLVGAGRAYTVDPVKGQVQQIDPLTLAAKGKPASFSPPLGQAGVDARGTLWVPAPQTGGVVPFRDGAAGKPVKVGRPGNTLSLSIAAGEPVVVDSTAATATVIKRSGAPLTVTLPSTVRDAGEGGVLAPASTEGATVPVLVPGSGSLLLLDTATGRHSSGRLKMPDHRYQAPQILGTKVYIPDETAGSLVVYDSVTKRFQRPIKVSGKHSPLEVFVKDGLLWAHNPKGSKAVVLDGKGDVKRIEKYKDKVPGGTKRKPLPVPDGDGRGGERGGDGRGGSERPRWPNPPQPTHTPKPHEPPLAPANLTVTPGSGTMTVDFQPSVGGKPTGYVLKGAPAGATVAPQTIAPGAAAHSFTVTGGDCEQEYRFRVAVQYKDQQGNPAEAVSQPTDPVRPCVPPGTPTGVKADATAAGAKITWAATPGATYHEVTMLGPVNTGWKKVTGTSVTFGNVSTNGGYTVNVRGGNAAGSTRTSAVTVQLTGPTQTYKVERNGNSTGYIRATADAEGGTTVATMNDNNGEQVQVHCQTKGVFYNRNDALSGDMYVYMSYGGTKGYLIGYMIDTPGDWESWAGPELWRCG